VPKTIKLLVGGLHLGGNGYPNAQQTLNILNKQLGVCIVECGAWLPDTMHLWRLSKARLPTKAIALIRFLLGNLLSVLKVLRIQGRERTPAYIPYPSIFFLWWSSWIPTRWRPRCIADAYISVWDSMYRDRCNRGSPSLAERALKAFESRALRAANVVLVDTLANKQMFAKEFGIDNRFIAALPLAIQDSQFLNAFRAEAKDETITVLFVGTLIPLHGINTILEAIKLLMPDPRFQFHLLGDGQDGYLIEHFSAGLSIERFTWIREWVDLSGIAEEIRDADICLGVFGGTGKAERVLPFKIYMYLASGKAIVTQPSFSLPDATPPPPLCASLGTSPQDVANAITQLANDQSLRNTLASDSRAYYIKYLGHDRLASDWRKLLTRFSTGNTLSA
jgi:glycosyltransferase involved in cell wall biosynthesis